MLLRVLCLALLAPFAAAFAQEYEMTTYFVAFLKRGAVTNHSAEEAKQIQAGHMAHIQKMASDGKLVLAGPFTGGGDLRGMFVFKTATIEEARAAAEQDPAVKAGRLVLEWHPWYSAKGIGILMDAAKK